MQNYMLSKILTLKIICIKVMRLFYKTYRVMVDNPRSLPAKITRKLESIIKNRTDLSFFERNKVQISGSFYPSEDLRQSSNSTSPKNPSTPIAIIIPVYRNLEITKRCIESVLGSNLTGVVGIFILNDCSPDPGMSKALEEYSSHPCVKVIHNPENVGFVRNVNNGMRLAGDADVVLLNSDTIVAGDWLLNLHTHSCSSDRVSSVTATSNNATICSFPIMEGRNSWPMGLDTKKVQQTLSRHNKGRFVKIPTAVGFCMYITRRSLSAIGDFDAEAFGKGYGEENDFCLRGLK
jgi:cellulose synthase/poly-beta-1,6-N-acetylglucosamine synthase-like glycosyltransferase